MFRLHRWSRVFMSTITSLSVAIFYQFCSKLSAETLCSSTNSTMFIIIYKTYFLVIAEKRRKHEFNITFTERTARLMNVFFIQSRSKVSDSESLFKTNMMSFVSPQLKIILLIVLATGLVPTIVLFVGVISHYYFNYYY